MSFLAGTDTLKKLSREERKRKQVEDIRSKAETRQLRRTIRKILLCKAEDRNKDDCQLLYQFPHIVTNVQYSIRRGLVLKSRQKEIVDDGELIDRKVEELVKAVRNAKCLVIYTGAGISTAAHIPDYRGPSGVWTLLARGKTATGQDMIDAEPTYTHMAISGLFHATLVKHVVSQNCDGLHLRSGLPRSALSEVHGNMYIEVCTNCKPQREYTRSFDVTPHTAFRRHQTGRTCDVCNGRLIDSIVHFGEKSQLAQPHNWQAALEWAKRTDMILCLGSSLKVLKNYRGLFCANKSKAKRPKVYIVNLQWTPKDSSCSLKINATCDTVMKLLMEKLKITVPTYERHRDPLHTLSVPVKGTELSTVISMHTFKMERVNSSYSNAAADKAEDDFHSNSHHNTDFTEHEVTAGWFGKGYRVKKKSRRQ